MHSPSLQPCRSRLPTSQHQQQPSEERGPTQETQRSLRARAENKKRQQQTRAAARRLLLAAEKGSRRWLFLSQPLAGWGGGGEGQRRPGKFKGSIPGIPFKA
jgi:hypothetical protein